MVLKETEIRNGEELKNLLKELKESSGFVASVLVGSSDELTENDVVELLPRYLEIFKKQDIKLATIMLRDTETGVEVVLNILLAEYIEYKNAADMFLIKLEQYGMSSFYVFD